MLATPKRVEGGCFTLPIINPPSSLGDSTFRIEPFRIALCSAPSASKIRKRNERGTILAEIHKLPLFGRR